jgi:hypothetical protein
MLGRATAWGIWLAILVSGCSHADPPRAADPKGIPWFADFTQEAGLHFVHDAGPLGSYFLPECMGSGAALFDFDNDGLLDVYLLQNGGPNSSSTNRLFRQWPAGKFTDVSAGSGLDIAGYNMGVAIGDVNNDGWPDVLVTQYGGIKLFLNNGKGKFSDVTQAARLQNLGWGTSACFFDYDRDGWLDLVVTNYVDFEPSHKCIRAGHRDYCQPTVFRPMPNKLFRNRGRTSGAKSVSFEDVSVQSGIASLPGYGLGVVCADFNGDGWLDVFVANDELANRLWINQRNGTFVDEALARGVAYNGMGKSQGNMGIALADVDGDGLLDLFVTHLTEEVNTLWRQGPPGVFRDQTGPAGLASPGWRGTGFGTVFGDFDQDGHVDLVIVNGRVQAGADVAGPTPGTFWRRYAERNQIFANDGTGRFRDLSLANAPLCGAARVSRGLACGDLDGDGALDLLVTTVGGPALLYRNVVPERGHWLMVRAVDPALRRDAYGARVTVQAGQRWWIGLVNPGQSYLCSLDPRVHFGLGDKSAIDAVTVLWPDGREEAFAGVPVDRSVVLERGKGKEVRGK